MPFSLPPPSIPRAVLTAFGEPESAPRLLCEWCWSTFDAEAAPELCPTCRSARPDASWPTLPYLFRNRYWFIKKLGRGGMGAVFLAYDPQAAAEEERLAAQEARDVDTDKSMVAVKVVQQKGPRGLPEPQQRSQRKLLKDAFQNEIAAARMVARYSRLFVTAKGHDDLDPAYLAMEYIHQGPARHPGDVPWQTLSALLGKVSGRVVPLPPLQVARIGVALLHGIGAMAQHNIVHNDLKPDNVFVRRVVHGNEERHEVKIMDLGVWTLDQALAETESVLYGVGDVRGGTADYMSPEQTALFANMPHERRLITRQSDLHAFSSVLWELATGRVPFPMKRKENTGDQSGAYAERLTRLATPPPRPAVMPEGLYNVLVRGLAKEPTDRWADAHEMREQLKSFIDDSLAAMGDVEQALSALKAQIEPFNQLVLRAARFEERWRAMKQARREGDKGAARGDTSSLVKEVHAIKEELTAVASKVSGSRSRAMSDSAAASSVPATRRSVSAQSSGGPLASSEGAPDKKSIEEPVREKKRSSIQLVLGAGLLIGAAVVAMLWMTGRFPMPRPIPAATPLPPSSEPVVATADPTVSTAPTSPPGPPHGPPPGPTQSADAGVVPVPVIKPPGPGPKVPDDKDGGVPPSPPPDAGPSKNDQIKAALGSAMASAAANAASCSAQGGAKGSTTVTVVLGANGAATEASLSPPFPSNDLNTCIRGFFMKIRIDPIGAAEIAGSRTVHIQ